MVCLHGQDPGSIAQDGGAGDESGAPLIRRHTHILKQEAACAQQPATSDPVHSTAALKAKPRLYCAEPTSQRHISHEKSKLRVQEVSSSLRPCNLNMLMHLLQSKEICDI